MEGTWYYLHDNNAASYTLAYDVDGKLVFDGPAEITYYDYVITQGGKGVLTQGGDGWWVGDIGRDMVVRVNMVNGGVVNSFRKALERNWGDDMQATTGKLPACIEKLESLTSLNLNGWLQLHSLSQDFGGQLTNLKVRYSNLTLTLTLTLSPHHCPRKELNLCNCSKLESLPESESLISKVWKSD